MGACEGTLKDAGRSEKGTAPSEPRCVDTLALLQLGSPEVSPGAGRAGAASSFRAFADMSKDILTDLLYRRGSCKRASVKRESPPAEGEQGGEGGTSTQMWNRD